MIQNIAIIQMNNYLSLTHTHNWLNIFKTELD